MARLQREAAARDPMMDVRIADMRAVAQVWPQPFDVVIACDNAIPPGCHCAIGYVDTTRSSLRRR